MVVSTWAWPSGSDPLRVGENPLQTNMLDMKHTFFAPPEAISGDTIVLPDDEARHAVRVLRTRTGDEAAVVDGAGMWYRIAVEVVGRKNLVGRILERRPEHGEPAFHLTIAICPLKNMARFEVFAEKATELGLSRITPVITKRSERSRLKASRLRGILTASMKQCGRSRLVRVDEPVKLKRFLKSADGSDSDFKGICHESAPPDRSLAAILRARGLPARATVLVGPEGGFTDEEIEMAGSHGFEILSLGERRLRAETAAITVSAAFMLESSIAR